MPGGKIQLNFHDGKNAVVSDGKDYRTGDVIVFDIKKKALGKVIPVKKGSVATITEGRNRGEIGRIEKIDKVRSSQTNRITITFGKKKVSIPQGYIFVLGEDQPVVGV